MTYCRKIWYSRTGRRMTIRRICTSCWIPKATDTHPECLIIFIAFPRQRERASLLRYTHITNRHTLSVTHWLITCNSLWGTLVLSECLLPSTKPAVPSPRSQHPGCNECEIWDSGTHARSEIIAEVLLRMRGCWNVTPCRFVVFKKKWRRHVFLTVGNLWTPRLKTHAIQFTSSQPTYL